MILMAPRLLEINGGTLTHLRRRARPSVGILSVEESRVLLRHLPYEEGVMRRVPNEHDIEE